MQLIISAPSNEPIKLTSQLQVIQKIGLCICLYDLLWASEGLIGHGEGTANVNGTLPPCTPFTFMVLTRSSAAEFRLVIFRPFKGETILGRISRCSPDGLWVRTDFFDSIFVDKDDLADELRYDYNESLWVWDSENGEMYYDIHETVRVSVIGEEWNDQTPTKPVVTPDENDENTVQEVRPAAYIIKGSMKADGLGVCLWWDS